MYFIGLNFISNLDVKNEFVKVNDAFLDVSGKILQRKKNVTVDECAKTCLSNENCLSFEMTKKGGKCFILGSNTDQTKQIKADKSKDYYHRIKCNYCLPFITRFLFSFIPVICDSICTS